MRMNIYHLIILLLFCTTCREKEYENLAYFDNGKIKEKTYYTENNPNFKIIEKYYKNGQKREYITLKDDKYHGKLKEFYKNGQIKTKVNYKNGNLHGPRIEYYKNGQIKSTCNYANDHIVNKCKRYYPNGNLREIRYYSSNGNLITYKKFDNEGNQITNPKSQEVILQVVDGGDTIKVNQRFKAFISLGNPNQKYDGFEVGLIEPKYVQDDSVDIKKILDQNTLPKKNDSVAIFERRFKKSGNKHFHFIVCEFNEGNKDSLKINYKFYKLNILVKK